MKSKLSKLFEITHIIFFYIGLFINISNILKSVQYVPRSQLSLVCFDRKIKCKANDYQNHLTFLP